MYLEIGGDWSAELGQTAQDWVEKVAFLCIQKSLKNINHSTDATSSLQDLLERLEKKLDISGQINTKSFNGRCCLVTLSGCSWMPLFGFVSGARQSKWLTNYVGLLVRGGTTLLLFDPNYGVGLFRIGDNAPLKAWAI